MPKQNSYKKQLDMDVSSQAISYGTLIELTMGYYGSKVSHRISRASFEKQEGRHGD